MHQAFVTKQPFRVCLRPPFYALLDLRCTFGQLYERHKSMEARPTHLNASIRFLILSPPKTRNSGSSKERKNLQGQRSPELHGRADGSMQSLSHVLNWGWRWKRKVECAVCEDGDGMCKENPTRRRQLVSVDIQSTPEQTAYYNNRERSCTLALLTQGLLVVLIAHVAGCRCAWTRASQYPPA